MVKGICSGSNQKGRVGARNGKPTVSCNNCGREFTVTKTSNGKTPTHR